MAPAAHLIPLHTDFRFVHEPLDGTTGAHVKRFVGRDDELDELVARILLSDGGAMLVTGYRGVGKSTFVNRVIQQVCAQLPELEEILGPLQFVDVHLNVPRAMDSVELMYHVLRGLYLRLASLNLLEELDASLRLDLDLAFSRTSRSIALKTSTALENTAGVKFGAPLTGILQSSSGFSLGTKRSAGETREIAYLTYDDKAAEYDLVNIARRLSDGFRPRRSRASAIWDRLVRRPRDVKRLKVLLVFDELDKIDDNNQSGPTIDAILANLKTLFTTSGISFLFVAGKDIHDRWLEDVGRGDSIYESVFSYALYLPPLWMHADPMCDPLLDGQAFSAVAATESAAAYAAFKKFLAFNGRGIPRRILRKFNERVRWNAKRAQLAFSRDDVRQFRFFAELYDVLLDAEATLLGELREDAWTGRTDRKRLGLYYLIDWILLRGVDEFTLQDAVAASRRLSHLIAPADEAAPGIVGRVLKLLGERKYLEIVEPSGDSHAPAPSAPQVSARYRLTHQRLVEMGSLAGVVEPEAQVVINESKQQRFGGRYEVLSVLGRGGMSTVYLALDKLLPRQVAIKEQLMALSEDREARNRIRTEAQALSQLQHENIVHVYDVDADAKQPYIVMEYVQGLRLTDLIGSETLKDESETLRIARQIVRAVQFIHDRGILWRDPKPANIMITPEGRVVLLDFGISHLLASADRGAGLLLGTPTYSSPEQLRGEPLDARSDIYSIGVVLYQMVSGQLPFAGDVSPEGIGQRLQQLPAPFGREVHVSTRLSDVVFKCLEPERDRRFQTAGALLEALPVSADSASALVNAKEMLDRGGIPDPPPEEGTRGLEESSIDAGHAFQRVPDVAHPSLVDDNGRVHELRPPAMRIGRHSSSDIQVLGTEVSRFHAEVTWTRGNWVLADKNSRHGTLLNGTSLTAPVPLRHRDRISLGRSGVSTLMFHAGVAAGDAVGASAAPRVRGGDLDSALAELRELATSAPLERVIETGLDHAIRVARAERGFIMTANVAGELTMDAARARGGTALPGTAFSTSRKIPEGVFASGDAYVVADLLDGDFADRHEGTVALGIRQVLCMPLTSGRANTPLGVLYLDSRERGAIHSQSVRDALQILSLEIGGAIERFRVQSLAIEKIRHEEEMKIAVALQGELAPETSRSGDFYEVVGRVIPCRLIGGDFLRVLELGPTRVAIAVGDVAGKGAPAGLLASFLMGLIEANAATNSAPSELVASINKALMSRQVTARFSTVFFATLDSDGLLRYCNAGHNPPIVITSGGAQRLEVGGPIIGLFHSATYEDAVVQLSPADRLIAYSDGVIEATNVAGEEFSEERLIAVARDHRQANVVDLSSALLGQLNAFRAEAPAADDASLLVLRYVQAGFSTTLTGDPVATVAR